MTTTGSNNRSHHKVQFFAKKPVVTGSSRDQISLLRDAPKLVASMIRRGLMRHPTIKSIKEAGL